MHADERSSFDTFLFNRVIVAFVTFLSHAMFGAIFGFERAF
jgi:hypothetical protein